MPEIKMTVSHEAGLHARPLALFVKVAKGFKCDVKVKNLTSGQGPSNGKSPLELLLLGVQMGHEIEVTAEGEQADQALEALRTLVESNFKAGAERDA
jgi:phosphotransferase system HPr (HPr) family protein